MSVKASVEEDAQPVRRSIPLRGRTLAYTATPGHLTIRNDKGEPTASMFYVAYTMPSAGRPRPVTFLFNGGPGSSTMWLHMGSFGPMKVDASQPETIAGPPFRYGANPGHLARHQRSGLHRRADHRPLARARQGRAQGLLRRRQGHRRLHAHDPALPDQIPALEQPEIHHRRKLRHDSRRGPLELAAQRRRAAQRHRLRLDRVQLRRFPGRPVADQLPSDLCRRRLVPRQDRRTSRRSRHSSSRRANSPADPMRWRFRKGTCSATRRGSRSRSRCRS